MTPAEFAVMWLFRIGAVAFLLWCAASVYRHKVRRNRRVGLGAPFSDDRSSIQQFHRIIGR